MSEEEKMINQCSKVDVITSYNNVPYFIIADELEELSREEYQEETKAINELYIMYKKGVEFSTEGSCGDYVPSQDRYKKASSIINKEARFLFANPPTFNVNLNDVDSSMKDENAIIQDYLDKVLKDNMFNDKLLKAAKDCFIGKRIAIMLNFNNESGISITFLNSLEFIADVDKDGTLRKIVTFFNKVNTNIKNKQRWFKKVYTLEDDVVYVEEALYDGLGEKIEDITKKRKTKFTYIPAVVVLNDGLTGEITGESELDYLIHYEGTYSKLANADVDAQRKSMNPTRYTIDASQESTSNLSIAPGSYWDLQSDEDKSIERQAQAGILEPSMAYSQALNTTLDRIENAMYSEVDVPNVNSEKLQGFITSGKTLKALYWGLVVRCDEKMLAWGPALERIALALIDGAKLYPESAERYSLKPIPDIEFKILVENNYPLPEDIEEEKNMDLAEIQAQTMSRKSYIKKWRKLNDKEADEELKQIKLEQDLFENSVLPDVNNDNYIDVLDDTSEDTRIDQVES